MSEQSIIKEICNGYGFDKKDIPSPDGFLYSGCLQIIKRPSKLYEGGSLNEKFCSHCLIEHHKHLIS